jgi:hypothetical protein
MMRTTAESKAKHRAAPIPGRASSDSSCVPGASAAARTIRIRVALALRKRGGRKVVLTPAGSPAWPHPQTRVDNTLVKAIARAHRWKRMMESGEYASVTELAAVEKINQSYLCRVLRLTLLAPDIVEAVLNGQQGITPQLLEFMKPFPLEWEGQKKALMVGAYEFRACPNAQIRGPLCYPKLPERPGTLRGSKKGFPR